MIVVHGDLRNLTGRVVSLFLEDVFVMPDSEELKASQLTAVLES